MQASFPTRATLSDALLAFRRYAEDAHVDHLNLRIAGIPPGLRAGAYDVVVFHTSFFAARWDAAAFRALMARAAPLARLPALKVMIPQDEFIQSDLVREFIDRFRIAIVFTVQPESEWESIYGTRERPRLHLVRVLTGYFDEQRLRKLDRWTAAAPKRDIDIGYRTTGPTPFWFGRHGFLKQRIADVFVERARGSGLALDISTSPADTLHGDDWYRFLARCKYTLGVEGGTSIIDRDGSIKARVEAFCARVPGATFEQVEAACFPGVDGTFRGFAISPRHLEACAMRVCQVLTSGHYNGMLRPGEHYIELKPDLSNVDEVIRLMCDDDLREGITRRAYHDVVESGLYTYRRFVELVLGHCRAELVSRGAAPLPTRFASYISALLAFRERVEVVPAMLQASVVVPLRKRLFRLSTSNGAMLTAGLRSASIGLSRECACSDTKAADQPE